MNSTAASPNSDSTIPVPLPRITRFEGLGYGLFLHWGLYSLLGKGEWVMHHEKIASDAYAKLADRFTAENFSGRAWAAMAREAGMRYAVLTTRHHDGFSLYDTRGLNDFDAPHSAAGRDLVADFVEGCRAEGIVPFFYHTTLDWRWGSHTCTEDEFPAYLDYLNQSVEILCRNYGEIGGFWFDGNWSRKDCDWRESDLYGMIRRHQPEAILVNNTGLGAGGERGHPELDVTTFEQGLPVAPDRRGWPKYLAVEMCQTINRHWGCASHDFASKSVAELIESLSICRGAAGANFLINVGPLPDGGIPELESTLLRLGVGRWLREHGGPLLGRGVSPMSQSLNGRDVLFESDGKLYGCFFGLPRKGSEHVVQGEGEGDSLTREFPPLDRSLHQMEWLDNGEILPIRQTAGQPFSLELTGSDYGCDWVARLARLE